MQVSIIPVIIVVDSVVVAATKFVISAASSCYTVDSVATADFIVSAALSTWHVVSDVADLVAGKKFIL